MASKMATHRHFVQHSRFTKQDGWLLWDLSLSLNGNIAIAGCNVNTHRTYIDVYTTDVRHSDPRDEPEIIYSKEFEKYVLKGMEYEGRCASFYPASSNTTILSGLGDKLEVIDLIQDQIINSRRIKFVNHDGIKCLAVRETEILISFWKSNKINFYDVIDLNEIKSIMLQEIQDGYYPYDMTAIADRIFVCVGDGKGGNNYKSLICEEKDGRILSELAKPTDTVQFFVYSVGVNMDTLGIAGVVWRPSYSKRDKRRWQIVFYSLLSKNNCSFLIVEVESDVNRIRISDRGDRMITGNKFTGEVKFYDMAELFTYSHFKKKLASTLQTNECIKLAAFFEIPRDQTDAILSSDKPSEVLLLVLEAKDILQSNKVDRLIEAFDELKTNPFCRHVAEVFRKTRSPSYSEEATKKVEEKMKILWVPSEEEGKVFKEKTTEVDRLKELSKLQEAHLKITQERDKFKSERDEAKLQLSSLQEELKASTKAKAETEKVLKQTEELLQKIIQEKNEIKTELKQVKVDKSLGSVSLEVERKTQAGSGKKTLRDAIAGEFSMPSPDKSKYLPESVLEGEFGKCSVRVSEKLTKANCVKLASYFNFPAAKIDQIKNDFETPGITLFNILKERHIVNIHNVMSLKEALEELELKDISDTIVTPYQREIDRLRFQQQYSSE